MKIVNQGEKMFEYYLKRFFVKVKRAMFYFPYTKEVKK
ncbi:Hypothetical protein BN2458_PEG1428 [Helicobacter typhlonius]|uniref:Uncharacterized protein n=1 Tax=Helicobacter typhlonius TaxID=76936 RepID=A0A0S4PX71_9HELI|nr:Hypothetical protein BN2458_PEG1428 [Helicobacter typhlonius]